MLQPSLIFRCVSISSPRHVSHSLTQSLTHSVTHSHAFSPQDEKYISIPIQICANTYKYMQIYTNIYKYIQIYTYIYRYIQIYTNIYICANICNNWKHIKYNNKFNLLIISNVSDEANISDKAYISVEYISDI